MQHIKIFFCTMVFVAISNFLFPQNSSYNYITDYYPVVYQAQYAYVIEEDREKAYFLLDSLWRKFGTLNNTFMPGFFNADIYLELVMEKRSYEKAKKVCRFLISEDGLQWQQVPLKTDGTKLLDSLEYLKFRWQFEQQIDTSLIKKCEFIREQDQKCRRPFFKLKEGTYNKDSLTQIMMKTDSLNQILLKQIFEQYGNPSFAQLGKYWDLSGVFRHISKGTDILYWKPVLLKQIKQGKCPPRYLGEMIDRYEYEYNRKSVYRTLPFYDEKGTLKDMPMEMVVDPEYLNERRVSIGLPPVEMDHAIKEANKKKY